MPHFGAKLSVTFGDPIPSGDILAALRSKTGNATNVSSTASSWVTRPPDPVTSGHAMPWDLGNNDQNRGIRIAVTEVIQRAVEDLGRSVSGPSLGANLPPGSRKSN